MGRRIKERSETGSVLIRNQDFAKGEELEPQLKKFFKNVKVYRRHEQISGIQTCRRPGYGGGGSSQPPEDMEVWGQSQRLGDFLFFEKNSYFNAIWITFRSFLKPFERTKFLRFESQLKKTFL